MFWPGKILLHYSYMAFWKNFKWGCIRRMIRVWAEERICKVSRGVWQEFMPHPFWCMIFYFGLFQNISRTTFRWGSSSSFRQRQFVFPFLTILIPKRGSLTNQSCVTRILTGVLMTSILMEDLKEKHFFLFWPLPGHLPHYLPQWL